MEWPVNNDAILRSVQELIKSNKWWFYRGETIKRFEDRFAQAHECKYGVAVCNGTIALDIVLQALDIGEGDKVVLPAYNYFSLAASVSKVGATAVFVDVSPDNPTLDTDGLAGVLSQDVKAVVTAHICGSVSKLDELRKLCDDAGVFLIEDCAQATGAIYDGRKVGSWGHIGLFSFGGIKLMTCGQGGMITTSDPDLYDKCYAIANRGRTADGTFNQYGMVGHNYGLTELAAAVLNPQLDILDELCDLRESYFRELDAVVANTDGLIPIHQFEKTQRRAQMLYSFQFDTTRYGLTREQFVNKAQAEGIQIVANYYCVDDDPGLFGRHILDDPYPNAKAAQETTVGIYHTHLVTKGILIWKDALSRLPEVLDVVE